MREEPSGHSKEVWGRGAPLASFSFSVKMFYYLKVVYVRQKIF